jgi:DNA-binding transcriptional MerR regulator/predicted transcriptional regulator YdeE
MKIGDFARLGQVSVRMLRHYDALGLLEPHEVDPWTGHRSYAPDQLATLHRIVALKELGLTLDQVGHLLHNEPGLQELHGMLRLRRSELEQEMQLAQHRLLAVEHRLRLIEQEPAMPNPDVVLRSLAPRRIAALSATVADGQTVGEVVEPLFVDASRALASLGRHPHIGVALYDLRDDGMRVLAGYDIHAALPSGAAAEPLEEHQLPAAEQAACAVHLGAMEQIGHAWQHLHAWLGAHGLEPDGPAREVYLEAGPGPDAAGVPERTTPADQAGWVTELQQPVRRR